MLHLVQHAFRCEPCHLVFAPACLFLEVQLLQSGLLLLVPLLQLLNVFLAQPLLFLLAIQLLGQVCLSLLQRVQLEL